MKGPKARLKQCVCCHRVGYRMEAFSAGFACSNAVACKDRILRAAIQAARKEYRDFLAEKAR